MPIPSLIELKTRGAAMEKEACAALSPAITCEAVPRWFFRSEAFPYWLNRIGPFHAVLDPVEGLGEEYGVYAYTWIAAFIVGHTMADVVGANETLVDTLIPQFVDWVDTHAWLQSAAYSSGMAMLRDVHFVSAPSGLAQFAPISGGVELVGVQFQIECTFEKPLIQAYIGGS